MSNETKISGRVIAAGRALAGIGEAEFAAAAGLSIEALRLTEGGGSAWVQSGAEAAAVRRGLEHFGVIVVEESEDLGAGVRLKFTRQDVRQIVRLEGEGGIVGSDDAP